MTYNIVSLHDHYITYKWCYVGDPDSLITFHVKQNLTFLSPIREMQKKTLLRIPSHTWRSDFMDRSLWNMKPCALFRKPLLVVRPSILWLGGHNRYHKNVPFWKSVAGRDFPYAGLYPAGFGSYPFKTFVYFWSGIFMCPFVGHVPPPGDTWALVGRWWVTAGPWCTQAELTWGQVSCLHSPCTPPCPSSPSTPFFLVFSNWGSLFPVFKPCVLCSCICCTHLRIKIYWAHIMCYTHHFTSILIQHSQ